MVGPRPKQLVRRRGLRRVRSFASSRVESTDRGDKKEEEEESSLSRVAACRGRGRQRLYTPPTVAVVIAYVDDVLSSPGRSLFLSTSARASPLGRRLSHFPLCLSRSLSSARRPPPPPWLHRLVQQGKKCCVWKRLVGRRARTRARPGWCRRRHIYCSLYRILKCSATEGRLSPPRRRVLLCVKLIPPPPPPRTRAVPVFCLPIRSSAAHNHARRNRIDAATPTNRARGKHRDHTGTHACRTATTLPRPRSH